MKGNDEIKNINRQLKIIKKNQMDIFKPKRTKIKRKDSMDGFKNKSEKIV